MLLQTKLLPPWPTFRTPLATALPAQFASGKQRAYPFQLGPPRLRPQCPLQQLLGLGCLPHRGRQLGTFVAAPQQMR